MTSAARCYRPSLLGAAPRTSAVSRPARSRRSGLTLLEVLIATFVLLVGILAVLTLVPVAAFRVKQALQADQAAAVAQCAIEEIKVRRLLDPTRWVQWDGTTCQPISTPVSGTYVIDPLFIAKNWTDTEFVGLDCSEFPYLGASNAVPRVTFTGTSSSVPIDLAPVKRVFVSHDDLDIEIPSDSSERSSLVFTATDGSYDVTFGSAAVQEVNEYYSWLATVAPTSTNLKTYSVAVAVFYKRSLFLPTSTMEPDDYGERIVDVTPLGFGVGGGEVRLSIPSSVTATQAYLDVVPGQWMLLYTSNVFCWYRIVSIADHEPGTTWRELTLSGPDWNSTWGTPTGALFTGLVDVHTETVEVD